MIFELYKKEGQTPLEAMEEFRKENLEYKDQKMTYAGRLDPMAEGVLLILTGDDCKEKQKYLGLNKEYEFEILWGFQTDTYDILGLDPMAEGVLLILTGDDCKEKQKYLGLNKEYEFEILWGFQTDTYDILGIPTW